MKMEEVVKRYPGEWLLIEYTRLDDDLWVQEGRVLAHSPCKEDLYALLPRYRGKKIALEYAGEFSEDVAVLF